MDVGLSHSAQAPLVIVIPAYNAAAHIGQVVAGVRAHAGHKPPGAAPVPMPIVVIDDGSQDGTADVAERAGALVLRHQGNRGKGAALQTGFAYALSHGAQAVLTLDADGQHDPAELPLLLAAHRREPFALVIGVRSFDAGLMPRRSRIGNTISTFFISLFAGQPYQDTQSGFRVYPAELLRKVRLTTRRFDTETELLLWAAKHGTPLCQVPIRTIYHRHRHRHHHEQRLGHSSGPGNGQDPAGPPPEQTHFRTLEDTLRVLRLVIGSPFWRTEAPAPGRQPKMETP